MKPRLTKSAPFIIMFLVMLQSIYSQDYLLTFSGSGQSSTVEIVEVKNIDQQTTLTLNGTDTLLLTDVVGTGYLPALNQGIIVYPNPANHSSRLEFYNSSAGNTSIEIYDFSGRLLNHKSIRLDAGNHAFAIGGLKAGIYLVKVNTPEHTYSQRLVSTSVQGLTPELQYEGLTQIRPQEPIMKSISNIVAMRYNDGERLVIKAISGDYAHTKSLIPTESQNIDFEFMNCIDGDGNHYGVVTIGEQVWMAENLKTTKYRNGTPIVYPGTNNNAWLSNTNGAYAWYNNDIGWKDIYGALYNWHAVNNARGLCPTGWHVPTDAEFTELTNFLGGGGVAGGKMKSTSTVPDPHPRWESPNTGATNESNWSGLPGGGRDPSGTFFNVGSFGFWWSSTEDSAYYALSRNLFYSLSSVGGFSSFKTDGYSVRCLKD
jgi:uncharacterized protein (TIGR02145 family)